jgi:hypothetical protein
MVPLEGQIQLLDFFGVPEPQNGLMKRALVEIGMPAILAHMNRFGMTLVQGDAHAGQLLRLSNDNSAKGRGFEWGLIDFAWAHLGSPAIDVGNFMMWPSVESVDHAKFVKFYFDQLIEYTGCSQPGSPNPQKLPSCSLEDFTKDCRIAATFRGLMMMAFTGFSFPEEARRDKDYLAKNPHFKDWFSGTHRGFRFLDQSTFDYLLERTVGTPAPTQAPTPAPTQTPSPTPVGDNCVSQPWEQCGGNGWSGATCCTQDLKCTVINEWYSQCEP